MVMRDEITLMMLTFRLFWLLGLPVETEKDRQPSQGCCRGVHVVSYYMKQSVLAAATCELHLIQNYEYQDFTVLNLERSTLAPRNHF